MLRCFLLLASALSLAACVPIDRRIEADRSAEVAAAHKRADKEVDAIAAAWKWESNKAAGEILVKLVYPQCDKRVPKNNICGLVADAYADPAFQKQFVEVVCANPPPDVGENYCLELYTSRFVTEIKNRYAGLDVHEFCSRVPCRSYVDAELRILKAHNASVSKRFDDASNAIAEKYKAKMDAVTARFSAKVDAISAVAAERLANARRKREALQAVAAGLSAAGESLSRGSGYSSTRPTGAWALSPGTAAALEAFQKHQRVSAPAPESEPDEAVETEAVDPDEATIFHERNPDALADRFRTDLAEAKVTRAELFETSKSRRPIRVHDLRATFVTLALAGGRTEAWVADRTGHRSSVMINRYWRRARHAAELNLGALAELALALPEFAEAAQAARQTEEVGQGASHPP